MDFRKFSTMSASEEGRWVDVFNPMDVSQKLVDENGNVSRVKIKGVDSMAFRRAPDVINKAKLIAEDKSDQNLHHIIAGAMADIVLDWEHVGLGDGDLPFNRENAVLVLTEAPWLREQLDIFLLDRANFLPASSAE